MDPGRWRRCSVCKQDIAFEQVYWVCSVSTCNRKRTGLAFCSTSCWDAHVPVMRHRDSWAVEERAPSAAQAQAAERAAPAAASAAVGGAPAPTETPSVSRAPRRVIAGRADSGPPLAGGAPGGDVPKEVLIVISKLKSYIRAVSGMNTADAVASALSEHVRDLCDRAIENARENERKTVLERDVPRVSRFD